ncbi:MAG: 50S ribosomal protein L23 [Alphaproteobacteria bacterium GM7ARS4]|nr:50S ribosomal protein L23 [Alphaproteobacteria bacterium GM7ARS4]
MTIKRGKRKAVTSSKTLRILDYASIVRSPVITEKATACHEHNQFTFKVAKDADKGVIKESVEALFGVKVLRVHTLNMPSKKKQFRGIKGHRPGYKKAIVRIAKENVIDLTEKILLK